MFRYSTEMPWNSSFRMGCSIIFVKEFLMKKVIFWFLFSMVLLGVYGQESSSFLTLTKQQFDKLITEGHANIMLPLGTATLSENDMFFVYLEILSIQRVPLMDGMSAIVARARDGKRYTFWAMNEDARILNNFVNKNRLYLCGHAGTEFLVGSLMFTGMLSLPEPTAGMIVGIVEE